MSATKLHSHCRYIFHTKGVGNDGGEVLEYYAGDNAIDEMRQDASVKEWLKEVGT